VCVCVCVCVCVVWCAIVVMYCSRVSSSHRRPLTSCSLLFTESFVPTCDVGSFSEARSQFLPPPRRTCSRRCLFVCSLATLFKKTSQRICMQFSGKVGNGPMNKWSNFGGDLVTVWIQELFPDLSLLGDMENGSAAAYWFLRWRQWLLLLYYSPDGGRRV